ncbi:hypothetical protein SS1G_09291 [Sclerotinia sclerotiorum 1980 UF-70]|uniref:Methyltransferase domain-containing protein n=1 Tax=Sclerotinia sclerotiorum (strain ATCC 18683 / 1980 / Ss-1) TaxID=665079 RepID=A7EVD3_SCLS1|nr:hypothetical protein SS1G_09291 [Sclerotinia sclerotiorum 1980 UF-70]EDN93425.1 hypothetical protein SS1G_09291 [Sclerotinia sclerotiorum 1980 UF-70]
MEMNTEPRVVTTPTSYIIEELGSYVDAREPELDNIRYQMMQLLRMTIDGKLFVSPLDTDRPINVLDVATGTGIWAVEFVGIEGSISEYSEDH